jgi:uncharacterized protein (DUF1778 family)
MKSRIRAPGGEARKNTLHIRFNDTEYQLLIDAAYAIGVTPSTFVAEISLGEAARILKKQAKK